MSLPLRCWVIEGKIVAPRGSPAACSASGRASSWRASTRPLAPLTNVKVRLDYPTAAASRRTSTPRSRGRSRGTRGPLTRIHFTSMNEADRKAVDALVAAPARGTGGRWARILILGGGFGGDPETRRSLLTFVVAGGGFSGVEAVAELNDFVRAAARSFRNVRPEEIRVVLLHSGELILPELPESLAGFAQRLLMKRGVELRLRTPRRRHRGRGAAVGRRARSDPHPRQHGAVGAEPALAALRAPRSAAGS